VKRGLFLKYVTLFVGLVTAVLVINAALDLYFVYQENRRASIEVQREKADAAAQKIESFVREIERQIGWVAYAQFDSLPADQRRFDYVRLLRQVPAITELAQLDRTGHEQLHVSRLSMDVVGSNIDRSAEPAFIEAKANKVYFGPVSFRKGSEPYLTMAVAHGGRGGVTVADINLKLIWDVISQIKIGQNGYAYVVDRQGRLVAHPDISLVLRGTDMSRLAQVEAALNQQGNDEAPLDARNRAGVAVLSAHATIPALNWIVFVELPTVEAQQPVIDSGLRDLALLVLGLLIAGGAAALLARRMVVPIRAMQEGAQRIGGGDLGHRLSIKTGDELEALADQFNRSTAALQESYETLEQRVEDRTRELTETLDQQTATAEVLRVISQSPTDVQPVLDVVASSALRFCGADFVTLYMKDGEDLVVAARIGVGLGAGNRIGIDRRSAAGRAVIDGRTVHLPNLMSLDPAEFGIAQQIARAGSGMGAVLAAPLMREGTAIGVITLPKKSIEPFTPRQIELLETFAAQAVIAIQNVRLFTELRETLEQQTATSEVLQVISQSPTDVQPVLDAVAESALRFCGATDVLISLREGDEVAIAAHRGPIRATDVLRFPLGRGHLNSQAILDGRTFHVPDMSALDPAEYAGAHEMSFKFGWKAAVVAPMMREGVAAGAILLRKSEIGPFTDRQIELLETFAAQAVIAIQNVRLFTELRESLEQQTATAEILRVISQSPTDVQPVLDAVARAAVRFCGAPDALIALRDGDESVVRAHHGALPATIGFRRPITTGASGEAIQEARTVQYPDTSLLDPIRHASTLARAQEYGFRATIAAPLLIEGAAIGAIVLRKPEPGTLAPRQVELLESFAAQAVIALQNVRLFTELRESLEQQTASSEILQVISQSPTDVTPVLSAVAKAAVRFCGAEDATISLQDGAELTLAAHEGPIASEEVGHRTPLEEATIRGRAILDRCTLHVPDVAAPEAAQYARTLQLAKEYGFRAVLAAPMLREGGAIGSIALRKSEPGAFTPRQIELLETFAAQAVIAIQNVRLFTELRESLEQQTASGEILQVISQSPTDVKPVLDAVAKAALRFCGATDAAIVLREGRELQAVAHEGPLSGWVGERWPLDRTTTTGRAIVDDSTVHIPDVTALDAAEYPSAAPAARDHDWRANLVAPMLREDEAVGAIVLRKVESGPFTPRQIQLLEAFAAQAVIAIENVRLFTEIREKSRQLEVASQHKSQFLANMSHELRTPLNAILGYAEMMVDGLYGDLPEKAQGVLERVQSNGKHLLGLINDVLDLSKIEAGQLTLAVEEYSVPDMVATVMSATESLARTKNIALVSAVPSGLPRGMGDTRRLTQVLLNLVGNAIKFTDEGKVEIRARQQGDRFKISVLDTGPGIAPADQAKIFEEFQQVDNTSTRRKGGTGLGLSISLKIVELHGGRITVESDIGKGSNFKITIPINVVPIKDAAQ
jgi:signal transduction histidine kinase/HAMP domain-containing protein